MPSKPLTDRFLIFGLAGVGTVGTQVNVLATERDNGLSTGPVESIGGNTKFAGHGSASQSQESGNYRVAELLEPHCQLLAGSLNKAFGFFYTNGPCRIRTCDFL